MYRKISYLFLAVTFLLGFGCSLHAQQESRLDLLMGKLKEFGWRVATYESEDKELWGNQGYIFRGAQGKKKVEVVQKEEKKVEKQEVYQPRMLREEELVELKTEIQKTLTDIEAEKGKRQELRSYLHQVENQLSAFESQFETKGGKTYTVQKGDSLWRIAKKEYGDGCKWPIIYKANQDKLKDPNMIYPGQKINLPRIKVKKE